MSKKKKNKNKTSVTAFGLHPSGKKYESQTSVFSSVSQYLLAYRARAWEASDPDGIGA